MLDKKVLSATITVLLAFVVFMLAYVYAQFLLAYAGGVLSAILGVWLVVLVDGLFLGKVDTYTEIVKKGNISYAIYFLGLCFIVGVFFMSAFVVFLK
jgi:hypothetical protein